MADHDPILPPREAATYLGFRGAQPTRSLLRLKLDRHPMPGVGTTRYGYRLSTLNRYLESLANPQSRKPRVRQSA